MIEGAEPGVGPSEGRRRFLEGDAAAGGLSLVVDPQGHILFASARWRGALGYTEEETRHLSLFEVTHRNDHAACQAWLQLGSPAALRTPLQLMFVAKDGRTMPTDGMARASVRDGRVVSLHGVFRDLSDRLQAENASRDQAELVRFLSLHAPAGVFQTDARGRLGCVNTRWRCIASLLHVEQPRGVWWQMVHPGDRTRVVSQWQSAIRQGHGFFAEFRVQTSADTECWVQTRIAQVLGSDGSLRCWIGITEDITAQRQAKAAQDRARQELEQHVLTRTAQLQASNRDLTEFASVVAHDLKAPLRSVSRLAEWLAEDYCDRLGPEGARLCQLLHQRVCHLHELIDGILAYTRIGRSAEREAEVDLNGLLAQIVQSLAPTPQLVVVIPPNLPTVRGVPEHLRQVFQNLLDNAFKYMNKRAGRVEVVAHRGADAWQFSVADNGPGIPARYHDKIFQIFQRLQIDHTTPGTGIGLSLVKRIVENRGGRVWVVSVPDEGATFHFTWPDQKPGQSHAGGAFVLDQSSG